MHEIAERFDWETSTVFFHSINVNEKSKYESVNGCLGYCHQGYRSWMIYNSTRIQI